MPARQTALRWLVLTLGALETLLAVSFAAFVLWTSDPLARAIGKGVAGLVAVPYLLFVAPALLMGLTSRWLPVALVLLVIAVPAALLALHNG
jgi:uncharacterized MnhB-related membrane protein